MVIDGNCFPNSVCQKAAAQFGFATFASAMKNVKNKELVLNALTFLSKIALQSPKALAGLVVELDRQFQDKSQFPHHGIPVISPFLRSIPQLHNLANVLEPVLTECLTQETRKKTLEQMVQGFRLHPTPELWEAYGQAWKIFFDFPDQEALWIEEIFGDTEEERAKNKTDGAFVLNAVRDYGYCVLKHAAEKLKSNQEIALAAIASSSKAFALFDETLKNNPDFQIAAYHVSPGIIDYIAKPPESIKGQFELLYRCA